MIIVIPAAVFAIILGFVIVYNTAKAKGYREGVANAQIDPATRLITRPVAEQILRLEFAAAERGRPLTIVLFSIDNFRRLAPLDGGTAGPRLLNAIGAIMRRRTRGMNVSSRFDDSGVFITILGAVEAHGALTFANRVRKDFASLRSGPQALVVSVSVCEYRAGMQSVAELISTAEGTLAEARAKGGNGMLIAGEEVFESETDVVFYR